MSKKILYLLSTVISPTQYFQSLGGGSRNQAIETDLENGEEVVEAKVMGVDSPAATVMVGHKCSCLNKFNYTVSTEPCCSCLSFA